MSKFFNLKSFIIALLGICFIKCSNGSGFCNKERIFKGYHVALDSIIKEPKGIIHGLELGVAKKGFKSGETGKPTESDESYQYYEYTIDSITNYSIAYSFANDSLDEIEVQIYCKNPEIGSSILTDLKNYYQKKYTAPIMDKGIYVYNCFDSRKKNFTITLTDNSGLYNSVINMLVYKEK